jgi:hypothetical protein
MDIISLVLIILKLAESLFEIEGYGGTNILGLIHLLMVGVILLPEPDS